MDTLLQNGQNEKKGIGKIFPLALLIAAGLIAGAIWLWSFQPSIEVQKQKAMEGAFLENSPEFEQYTKDIVIQTDADGTMQSPTGMGTIMMSIPARIRNKGARTINGLEVRVGVVDTFGKIIREKVVNVIPQQQKRLEPGQTIPVVATVDGFSKEDDRANVRWKVTAIRVE
ncbi:MAG: hypothetical protein WKF71_12620 [Pyrinomonadaceae bacterium]